MSRRNVSRLVAAASVLVLAGVLLMRLRETNTPGVPALQFTTNIEIGGAQFEKIGNSNFYRHHELIIRHDNGKLKLYTEHHAKSVVSSDEVVKQVGLAKFNKDSPDLNVVILRSSPTRGHTRTAAHDFGGSGMSGPITDDELIKQYSEVKLPKGSISEQLRALGFTEQKDQPGVFLRELRDNDKKTPLFAIVSDETLRSLIHPIPRSERYLGDDAKIISITKQVDEFDKKRHVRVIKLESQGRLVTIYGAYGEARIAGFKFLKEPTLADLGFEFPAVETADNGFTICGKNDSKTIRGLKSLKGTSIAELEERMRPNSYSRSGFISKTDSLLAVIEKDNDYVLGQGLTHKEIAEPMFYVIWLAATSGMNEDSFPYKGSQYRYKIDSWMGSQISPFHDGTGTSIDVHVWNETISQKLWYSGLLPEMIARYGFYEGDVRYRVNPADVIKVFELKRKKH